MISSSLFKRIAYVYLLIPIFIFGVGWLNTFTALVFSSLIIVCLASVWKKEQSRGIASGGMWDWIFSGLMLISWVYLSGIGGYAFQNWDHHSRNAVFNDLIRYEWPVAYHLEAGVATQFDAPQSVFLSYYFGFWLPAALFGKVAGMGAANLFLFIWSLAGLVLAVVFTRQITKLSMAAATILLIFFSGMDVIGVWLFQWIPSYHYPGLWPPIQHLEWWAGSLQYSSFTTSLFWTYNQFVPALLIMSLFALSGDTGNDIFLLGICFFFAPLPALGLLPFVVLKFIKGAPSPLNNNHTDKWPALFKKSATVENLAGFVFACIALLFYSTNLSAQSRTVQLSAPFLIYLIFIFLEGMLIWLLLLHAHLKDWMWYVSGLFLIIAPYLKVGESWDFVMRTTLPPMYILMVGCGSFLVEKQSSRIKPLLVLLLALGALTPINEINRSLVRTDRYYGYLLFSSDYFETFFLNPPQTNQSFIPESDHLGTLTANDWRSVSMPNKSGWETKVGIPFESAFRLLWRDELIQK